jgi:ribosomal protein L22
MTEEPENTPTEDTAAEGASVEGAEAAPAEGAEGAPAEGAEAAPTEGAEAGSPSEAGRSEEPGPAAADETTRPASAADPSSSPHGDELADVVSDSPESDAPAPARRRRRSRRRAAESAPAEPEAAESEPEAAESEPEAAESETEPEEPEATEPEPEAPAAPAPTRRRARRDPDLPAPVVRAQAKYVRSSARKARLVCDHIRGKSVEEARAILALTPRAIAQDWSKLLESAIANAEHNHELVGEDLYVKSVHADEGPTIKRFRPRAMGRATRIRKRTSHLTILLTPKD